MNEPNNKTTPQSQAKLSWFPISLRWLVGGIVGYIFGSYLNDHYYDLPYLFPLFIIQQSWLEFYFVYKHTFLNKYLSPEAISSLITFIHLMLFGLLGALLASGRKKQIKIGKILAVLYIVMGFLLIIIFLALSFPT
jgi:hypothetical protein